MHVSYVAFGDGSALLTRHNASGASHVLYARSEDGGATFERADGTPIGAPPIIGAAADVVLHADPGDLLTDSAPVANREGRPMVSHMRGRTPSLAVWVDGTWHQRAIPGATIAIAARDTGELLVAGKQGTLQTSGDGGQTWVERARLGGSTDQVSFDADAWRGAGIIRVRRVSRAKGAEPPTVEVITVPAAAAAAVQQ